MPHHEEDRLRKLETWQENLDAALCGELGESGRMRSGVFQTVQEHHVVLYGSEERRVKGVLKILDEHENSITALKVQDRVRLAWVAGMVAVVTFVSSAAGALVAVATLVKHWSK